MAYSIFFGFLALWLFFILSVTIVFANQFMLALFEGSVVLASILSLLLGLNFLGINFKSQVPRQNLEKGLFLSTEQNSQTPEISSINSPTNQIDPKKNKNNMKAFYLFGETEFNHCAYAFGYLGGTLKDKPVPDECFGCPKLVECTRTT